MNGQMAQDSLANHRLPDPKPSIVIGLDLFFWDASKRKCDEKFMLVINRFINLHQKEKIPMIIGKLPIGVKFSPGYASLDNNPCTDKIKSMIGARCTPDQNCILYDSKLCLEKIINNIPREKL